MARERSVLRVGEYLPYPQDRVWRALTDPDLIARWLMPNDFRLEAGHRFAIISDPIRRCGTGGTGHCEVLAFDEGTMLRIAWTAAASMSYLDSAATFTVTPDGAGTRLLVEHDGVHERLFTIVGIGCGPDGCRRSTRHIGEAAATIDGWHAALGRLAEALRLRLYGSAGLRLSRATCWPVQRMLVLILPTLDMPTKYRSSRLYGSTLCPTTRR